MPDRLTNATVNLQHYTHNITKLLENLSGGTILMAVVKANAYGHGLEACAAAAIKAGAGYIGVVSLGELKRLRQADITAPILLLNYLDEASLGEALDFDASITVMDSDIIRAAQQAAEACGKTLKIHIKIDTGMHRAGCDPDDLVGLARSVQEAPNLELEGVFTHFAESESEPDSFTRRQLEVFTKCVDDLKNEGITPPLIHCANSAAIIAFSEAHFTMVRPGLITYGLNPFPAGHPKHAFVAENFKPVLSLRAQIVLIRIIEPGETVGYNRRWKAERQSVLALLPVGYGDGWRRTPHNAGRVLIGGQYAPIVGSVAMDQTVVDITDIDGVAVGDEAVLLGSQGTLEITADDIAAAYGTINYEVVTSLSDRIDRKYDK